MRDLYLGNGYDRQFGQWYAEAMKILEPDENRFYGSTYFLDSVDFSGATVSGLNVVAKFG